LCCEDVRYSAKRKKRKGIIMSIPGMTLRKDWIRRVQDAQGEVFGIGIRCGLTTDSPGKTDGTKTA